MDMETRIRDSFSRQSMMDTLGAKIASVAPGAVEIRAPILPIALQQQGFGHAGLAFSLGDTAAGYSALSLMPEDQEVVTAEIRIHLLAPARGDLLIARGKVVKPGRRLMVVQAEVFARTDESEVQIALLTGTMVPVPA